MVEYELNELNNKAILFCKIVKNMWEICRIFHPIWMIFYHQLIDKSNDKPTVKRIGCLDLEQVSVDSEISHYWADSNYPFCRMTRWISFRIQIQEHLELNS